MRELRTTYDPLANAAYIYLVPHIEVGQVRFSTLPRLDTPMSSIIVDLDEDERVLGIELLGVSNLLASARLAHTSLAGACLTYDAATDVARVDLEPIVEPESECATTLIDTPAALRVGFGADGTLARIAFIDASDLLPPSAMPMASGASGC